MKTLNEYKKKYCTMKNIMRCKQATMDFLEEMEDIIENSESKDEIQIGSISYDITCLLEIMDKSLFDYTLLTNMLEDLNSLRND